MKLSRKTEQHRTKLKDIVPEADKCELLVERRWLPHGQTKELAILKDPWEWGQKSTGIQRKYLVQAGNWGGPCNLVVTELSDFRLKALWGLCKHNKCSVFFLFHASDNLHHLLLCKGSIKEHVKISVQLFCFPSRKDGWWLKSVRVLNALKGSAISSLSCFWALASCTEGQLWYGAAVSLWVSLLGKSCERPLWGSPAFTLQVVFRLRLLLLVVA